MTPAALYVHVPFCSAKCGYCDFYSHPPAPHQPARLVRALLAELDASPLGARPSLAARTIFIGGGTPTVLPLADFRRLFKALGAIARRDAVPEFTVEVNPATADPEKVAILRDAGVNRISLGAQSFQPAELAVLDRKHAPDDIEKCSNLFDRVHFEHLSLDLIFGIPGQTPESWQDSLRQAVALGADHVACYSLTYEPGTPLHARLAAGAVTPLDDQTEAALYEQAIDTLTAYGFEHYEISNFARPAARCQHNLAYWRNDPYLGVGPSAVSYLDGQRITNIAYTETYIARIDAVRSPVADTERLDPLPAAGELAMLQLRLTDGIDIALFRARTGFDPLVMFDGVIRQHAVGGRLVVTKNAIRLTRAGLLVADSVMADFVAAAAEADGPSLGGSGA
jgi:oxygen-independent coproporphyrinogen-3 oxidase